MTKTPEITQVDFFDILDPVEDNAPHGRGVVYCVGPAQWVAEIAGGWWVGHGKTRESAIKTATNNYHNETA